VHGSNLRIRLTMRNRSLTVVDEPGFAAVFENTGSVPLTLSPYVVSNVRVFDERGNLMDPACISISEPSGPAIIGTNELVRLPAGGTWVKPLAPAFVSGGPESVRTYGGECRPQGRERFLLPPGSYTARFTYLSYPGHMSGYVRGQRAGYDLREAVDVWEGWLESDTVTFSVLPAQEAAPGRLAGATANVDDRPWPPSAIGFTNCAARQPEWWFRDNPGFAAGICGTADAFKELRAMLVDTDEDVRLVAESALTMLTFVGENGSPELASPATPADWDAWYREHRSESRAEWAARRLRDAAPYPLQLEAAEYLARLRDRRWLPTLRAAAAGHPSAWARVYAARGVADFDRAEAVAFLKRELNNRDLWICAAAVEALNRLTGQRATFDFRIPSERTRAIDAFAATR
jgi:hypothetical protein